VSLVEATQLFTHYYSTRVRIFSALRRLYFGRANAIVRLRRNQNPAVLPFFGRIEGQTKASGNSKLIFLSAQSTHLDYMLFPIGHACLRTYAPLGELGGKNSDAT
jgi:hypothetical protein